MAEREKFFVALLVFSKRELRTWGRDAPKGLIESPRKKEEEGIAGQREGGIAHTRLSGQKKRKGKVDKVSPHYHMEKNYSGSRAWSSLEKENP